MTKRLSAIATQKAIRALGIDRPSGTALGILDRASDTRYAFHRHRRHQFLFPLSGLLFVETDSAIFPCSPKNGLWIPAGTSHATTTGPRATVSVFFERAKSADAARAALGVSITPLLRETALRAAQGDGDSRSFRAALFEVIQRLIGENLLARSWPSLPVPKSEALRRSVEIAFASLDSITLAQLARLSGQSERTMRRRFARELGMGPELFLLRARLIRSMQLLVERPGSSVTEIAFAVGYQNHSAFTAAFRRFCGQTPSAFRFSLPASP